MSPFPHPDDRSDLVTQWIAAARGGAADALGRLLESCRQYLLLIANQEIPPDLKGKVGGSDVVQETFLEAQRDFHRFHGNSEEELLAWLRQLLLHNVANISRHYHQTEKRQVRREVSLDVAASELAEGLVAPTESPTEEAIAREERRQLQAAIDQLPAHYREIVLLRHRGHLSFDEIAQRTGRTAASARKVWARAVEQLQHLLEPPHEA